MSGTRGLREDESGAVVLFGVFGASFLVGALWYVIGLGDAVVYREFMQDGADATAFAAAVYQARGMNVLALLNLVMAAVLMILVALKIAQLLLIATNVVSCLLGSFLNPLCDLTTAAEEPMETLVADVETVVDKVLRGLHLAERGVAMGVPLVAEAKSIAVASGYRPTVHGGLMVSASLIPQKSARGDGSQGEDGGELRVVCQDGWLSSVECSRPSKQGACSWHGGIRKQNGVTLCRRAPPRDDDQDDGSSSSHIRWGLPVEDDDFSVLCGHAAEFVADFVFMPLEWLGVAGAVKDTVGGFLKELVETFPTYFCGGDAAAGASVALQHVSGKSLAETKKAGEDACKNRKKVLDAGAPSTEQGGAPSSFDYDKCRAGLGKALGGLDGGASSNAAKTCQRVYTKATAGDDYFASWSFVWGDLTSQSSAHQGVAIAAWGRAKPSAPSLLSRYHFAKSEFYYEPKPHDADRSWPALVDEAMWNMRWRARLRRFRLPSVHLGGVIGRAADLAVEGLGGSGPIADGVRDLFADSTGAPDGAVDSALEGLGFEIIH